MVTSDCFNPHEKRLLFSIRQQPLCDCQKTALSPPPLFYFSRSVCRTCSSCCCDQSQFNRHRLKVNLQGAGKADRWELTAFSPTHIKAVATVAASEEDGHFSKATKRLGDWRAQLVERRGTAERLKSKRAQIFLFKRAPFAPMQIHDMDHVETLICCPCSGHDLFYQKSSDFFLFIFLWYSYLCSLIPMFSQG